jgi:hypothetical protein
MCPSYESNNPKEDFDAFSIFPAPNFDYKGEIYKDYVGPIFRHVENGWSTDPATFGMVPRKRIPPHVKPYDTMNARAETIGEKRSFCVCSADQDANSYYGKWEQDLRVCRPGGMSSVYIGSVCTRDHSSALTLSR